MPRFPVEYLPPVIADFVKAISENLKAYPEMPAAYSLAVLSLCCQQKARIRATITWAEELNLHICIVADPLEMKSPVFNTMIEPVRKYMADCNKAHTSEIAALNDIRDSLILQKNQLKGKRENEDEICRLNEEIASMESAHLLRLITTDSTNEALIEMMEENNGSVGIFCQKKVLADIMSSNSFTEKGLTQRFMYCMPESRVGTRTLIEPSPQKFIEAKKKYSILVKKLLAMPMTSKNVYLNFTSKARNAFAGYYSKIITENVDKDKIFDNITIVQNDVKAVYHELFDEVTPHLHIDYIPVGHYKRGMDIQNGIAQVLKEMGYGEGKQAIARWLEKEVEVLNEICHSHGIEPLPPEKS